MEEIRQELIKTLTADGDVTTANEIKRMKLDQFAIWFRISTEEK